MKRSDYFFLFLLGLATCLVLAYFQGAPGYMDADYYTATGVRLASGQGFTENFLWNYLDDPAGLPHPSHAYWMPLASMLAALGIRLAGSGNNVAIGSTTAMSSFSAARLPFLLLASFVPPLTARLGFVFYPRRSAGLLAGLLAVFSGFYLPFMATTDTFASGMLLGAVWFLVASVPAGAQALSFQPVLLGVLAGFLHLGRADGVLWLLPGLLLVWFRTEQAQSAPVSRRTRFVSVALLLSGYLVVMGPWLGRNLAVFGSPLPPGSGRVLWLTDYDDLYLYPGAALTPARWVSHGLSAILAERASALGQNFQTALAVQGMVFVGPLALIGAWRLRRTTVILLGWLVWALILLVMTVVFPFAGARGGFFHSGAPLQPLIWALAPLGLAEVISWGAGRRGWKPVQAWRVLGGGLVLLALLLSISILILRVTGFGGRASPWGQGEAVYSRLAPALVELGVPQEARLLVNNPPGSSLVTGRPSLAIPDGDLALAQEVAQRYVVEYLLLESNHPQGLTQLFSDPGDRPGLDFLGIFEGVQVYQISGGLK